MIDILKMVSETTEFIKKKSESRHEIGIILGSGLGPLVNEVKEPLEIEYKDIPHFPLTTVQGHAGKIVSGILGGKRVLVLKGRFHHYEGYDISQVTFAIRVLKKLGIDNLLVTNAAGGINKTFKPGDLMLINDHISFFAPSPLRGKNLDEYGPRFPDMSEAYSQTLIDMAKKASSDLKVSVQEGVYAFAQGPMYETPAEIRALAVLGADAVGMSTVPEVITAKHAGMNVLGISCITNMAAGILKQPLNHEEVMKTASEVEQKFTKLVGKIVEYWDVNKG